MPARNYLTFSSPTYARLSTPARDGEPSPEVPMPDSPFEAQMKQALMQSSLMTAQAADQQHAALTQQLQATRLQRARARVVNYKPGDPGRDPSPPFATDAELAKADMVMNQQDRGRWGTHKAPAPVPPAQVAEQQMREQGTYRGGYVMSDSGPNTDGVAEEFNPNLPRGTSFGGQKGMASDLLNREPLPRGTPLIDRRPYATMVAQDTVPGTLEDEATRNGLRAGKGLKPVYSDTPVADLFKDGVDPASVEMLAAQLAAQRRKAMGIADPEFIAAQPLY